MTRKAITAALLTSAKEIAAEEESDQNSNFKQTLPPYLNEVKNWVTSVLKVYVQAKGKKRRLLKSQNNDNDVQHPYQRAYATCSVPL